MDTLLPVLEAIVSFIEEGVLITDTSGEVLYQNPAAGALLGFPPNEPIRDICNLRGM